MYADHPCFELAAARQLLANRCDLLEQCAGLLARCADTVDDRHIAAQALELSLKADRMAKSGESCLDAAASLAKDARAFVGSL